MKLFYCHKAEDEYDIKRIRELLYMRLGGKISKEEHEQELKKIKERQLSLL